MTAASPSPDLPDDLPDDIDPPIICPATGMYCEREFCADSGCAKKAGIWDEDDL